MTNVPLSSNDLLFLVVIVKELSTGGQLAVCAEAILGKDVGRDNTAVFFVISTPAHHGNTLVILLRHLYLYILILGDVKLPQDNINEWKCGNRRY